MKPQAPIAYGIERLASHHDRAAFACGVEALDRYLKEQAGQDARRYVAASFVLVRRDSAAVVGFYTLSATAIRLAELPPAVANQLPKYPLAPATLLGRLAVDQRERGKRLGEFLLLDALHRSYELSREIASAAVVVEALDSRAGAFYRRYDFIQFPESPHRLFLPVKTIQALFA